MNNSAHPVVCKPSVVLPPYTISQEETLDFIQEIFSTYTDLPYVLNMIRNTKVLNRHLVRPIEETKVHTGITHRHQIYTNAARSMSETAAREAVKNADLAFDDITMIIATSCTGFTMPSLTAMLINDLKLKQNVRQLPIAQLGCCAGAAAVNLAVDHCRANKHGNVLIISAELASLCFQPDDVTIPTIISSSLFGDAVTGVVVRSEGGNGFAIEATKSFFMPDSEHYIAYDFKDTGFHFKLDKEVMHSIQHVVPVMRAFSESCYGIDASELDFFFFHTGGRRIMDELVRCLRIDDEAIRHSRNSLAQNGNISSAVVFDVLNRFFLDSDIDKTSGQRGMMAAFGPGFTAEMSLGYWV